MSASNYPDGMTNEDYKYVNGERSIDIASEQFEDLPDEDKLFDFFFDEIDGDENCGDAIDWIRKNKPEVLWEAIAQSRDLQKAYEAFKRGWIDKACDALEDR